MPRCYRHITVRLSRILICEPINQSIRPICKPAQSHTSGHRHSQHTPTAHQSALATSLFSLEIETIFSEKKIWNDWWWNIFSDAVTSLDSYPHIPNCLTDYWNFQNFRITPLNELNSFRYFRKILRSAETVCAICLVRVTISGLSDICRIPEVGRSVLVPVEQQDLLPPSLMPFFIWSCAG